MTTISSPTNTNSLAVDSAILKTSTAGLLKRGINSQSTTGGDTNNVAQEVGTHVDDAAFGVATDTVMAIAGLADDTSPDSVNEGDAGAVRMSLARALHVVNVCDTATVTSVNSAATSTALLALNANRIGMTLHNTDANALFLKYGTSATTTTSYTVKIASDGYWEMPSPIYRGAIEGIWAADGSGSAQITELT